ncbi:hypothetical protein VitviT2T_005130 [Vitis vinifera]|uniref:Uncharacterized protein n=1 Tax=Vitis vinifera TaxID=29760 RepID=A0ABY9BRW5_VITVI|nr:hypothetical protein VitviT2T_005130 [Vitis vinifera]
MSSHQNDVVAMALPGMLTHNPQSCLTSSSLSTSPLHQIFYLNLLFQTFTFPPPSLPSTLLLPVQQKKSLSQPPPWQGGHVLCSSKHLWSTPVSTATPAAGGASVSVVAPVAVEKKEHVDASGRGRTSASALWQLFRHGGVAAAAVRRYRAKRTGNESESRTSSNNEDDTNQLDTDEETSS